MSNLPSLQPSFLLRQDIGSGNLSIATGKSLLRKKFDFDVYLPSRKMNLQRPLVWSLDQKKALIESVLIKRLIPPVSVIQQVDDTYQVIDGKQRLSALIEYLQGKFDFCGYTFENLPKEYSQRIESHHIVAYSLCEYGESVSDDDKIEWFRWINFAGNPQDKAHMDKLS